jgi:hypothetical protein
MLRFLDIQTSDPIAYVLSLNLHRRHLDESQRSMIGARAKDLYAKQAKERQAATRKRGNKSPVMAKSPRRGKGAARELAGKAVSVSGRSIDKATKVIDKGVPELAKAGGLHDGGRGGNPVHLGWFTCSVGVDQLSERR